MTDLTAQVLGNLGVAASVVIVGGAIVGLASATLHQYRRTIGSRRDLMKRFNQLACGATLRYVEARFGTPVFAGTFAPVALPAPAAPLAPTHKRAARKLNQDVGSSGLTAPVTSAARSPADDGQGSALRLREFIFRERHAWLQVLADENDAVARFSITVTDPRFKFSVKPLTWGHLAVRLGHSPFSEVQMHDHTVWGRSLRIGAHAYEYAEDYYFGNPGMYQHFVLSNNELGAGSFGHSIQQDGGPTFTSSGFLAAEYEIPVEPKDQFDDRAAYASKFRAATTINTLTVLGKGANPDLRMLAEPRGPDPLRARMLLPTGRELRQVRRRIKRANAEAEGNARQRYLRRRR